MTLNRLSVASMASSMALRVSMQRIPSVRGPVWLPDCPEDSFEHLQKMLVSYRPLANSVVGERPTRGATNLHRNEARRQRAKPRQALPTASADSD